MLYTKRTDAETVIDVSEDFTLPDYQPEIRRIIGVRSSASADGKYLTGDELEADGTVTYTVIYTGGDGELAQTAETSSFTGKIPLKTEDDRFSPAELVLSGSADFVSCRVTAPRKFTLSSKVRLGLTSAKLSDVSCKSESPVIRRKTAEITSAGGAEVRHTAEASGEIREREGMSLVSAYGEVCVSDVRFAGDSASVKGDAYVSLLLKDSDGKYVTSRSRAPVDENIKLPDDYAPESFGEKPEFAAAAFPSVTMTEVNISDSGVISWNMEYAIDVDLMKKIKSEITDDAYIPTAETDTLTKSEIKLYDAGAAVSGRLTFQQSAQTKPDSECVFAWGRGDVDKITIKDGRIAVAGNVKINYVTRSGGEFTGEETSAPFKYEADAMTKDEAPQTVKKCSVNVCDVSVRQDGTNLNFTSELSVSVFAWTEKTVSAVVAAATDKEKSKEEKNKIRVYIPDKDETPWSVEKKFRLGEKPESVDGVYII